LYVNPAPYKDGLGEVVNTSGQLKVNEFLEVEGQEDIYAIGDCNSRSPTLAYAASEQAKLTVKNIYCKHTGESMSPWKDDASLPVKVVMSIGPNEGLGEFTDGRLFPEALAKTMKSNDLMVADYWKRAGLPEPS